MSPTTNMTTLSTACRAVLFGRPNRLGIAAIGSASRARISNKAVSLSWALLLVSPASHAVIHTWSGSGQTARWSDASNWQGNSAPQPNETGATLVFPAGGARLNSSNDVPGLALSQITFSGANYILSGTNALILEAGAGDTLIATGISNRVMVPLILQATNSFSIATNAALCLAGKLSGPGAFVLKGGGLLALAPKAGVDNAYLGTAQVVAGTLQLESGFLTDPIFGSRTYAAAVPGPLVVGDPGNSAPAILTGMALSTNTDLTVLGSGQYLVNGDLLGFGSLAGDGFVDFQGQSFIVGNNGRSTVFSGRMNGRSDAGFQKVGAGSLALTGSDIGPVNLAANAGTLVVDGNYSNSTVVVGIPVNASTGGNLRGSGVLGGFLAYGPVSPGHDAPGRLTATRAVFDLGSSFVVKLGGTNAGVDYDQLVATDTFQMVDLSAALKVQMMPGFTGTVGNQYTIVRLDGTNAVIKPPFPGNTNGFNGLGEGSVLTAANGAAFRISYQGGDGNDIVLTQIGLPAQPLLGGISALDGGGIRLAGTGYTNATYTVWANTNLAAANWAPIGTASADNNGLLQFTDANATNYSCRFYRLSWP